MRILALLVPLLFVTSCATDLFEFRNTATRCEQVCGKGKVEKIQTHAFGGLTSTCVCKNGNDD